MMEVEKSFLESLPFISKIIVLYPNWAIKTKYDYIIKGIKEGALNNKNNRFLYLPSYRQWKGQNLSHVTKEDEEYLNKMRECVFSDKDWKTFKRLVQYFDRNYKFNTATGFEYEDNPLKIFIYKHYARFRRKSWSRRIKPSVEENSLSLFESKYFLYK